MTYTNHLHSVVIFLTFGYILILCNRKLSLPQIEFNKLSNSPSQLQESEFISSFDRLQILKEKCASSFAAYKSKTCVSNQTDKDGFLRYPHTFIPLDCEEKAPAKPIWGGDWIADKERKMLFCLPPKSGCTSVNFIYQAMKTKNMTILSKEIYRDWKDSEKIYKIMPRVNQQLQESNCLNSASWKRAINIRHPFERLYSGWKDKFDTTKPYARFFRKYAGLAKKYQTSEDKHTGDNYLVSFEAFLEWVSKVNEKVNNNHFKPMSYFCDPCEVDFTHVTQTETLTQDVISFFKDVSYAPDIQILNFMDHPDKNYFALQKYPGSESAKTVFLDIATRKKPVIEKIYEYFYWDFELFGYTADGYL